MKLVVRDLDIPASFSLLQYAFSLELASIRSLLSVPSTLVVIHSDASYKRSSKPCRNHKQASCFSTYTTERKQTNVCENCHGTYLGFLDQLVFGTLFPMAKVRSRPSSRGADRHQKQRQSQDQLLLHPRGLSKLTPRTTTTLLLLTE